MKTLWKCIALLCIVLTVAGSIGMTVDAATISTGGRQVSGIRGGQSVCLTTNKAWYTSLSCGIVNTIVKITIPIAYRDNYRESKTGDTKAIQLTVYKKAGDHWVKQDKLSGKFHCNPYSGILTENLRLPGKGVQYKITITPERQGSLHKASDMTGIKFEINYGVITGVK